METFMGPQAEVFQENLNSTKETLDVYCGVKDWHKPTSKEDHHVEEINRDGYTVFENLVTEEDLSCIRNLMDEHYQQQAREIGGENMLYEIGDSDSVKHLLVYDDIFMRLASRENLMSIIKRFLGDYFTLNLQNGIINRPNIYNPASLWHRDLFYQHYTSSRPLAISVLYCIDDFNEETGGTVLLPGSHKHEEFPSRDYTLKHQSQVSIKAGSAMVFDPMMYHRAGFNKSNTIRRGISHIFTLPSYKQQISFPRILKGKYSDNPFLRKLLGYDCETADNLLDWRKQRLQIRAGTGYTAAQKI